MRRAVQVSEVVEIAEAVQYGSTDSRERLNLQDFVSDCWGDG